MFGSAEVNVPAAKQRSGGELLVDALRLHGIDTIFGVPGESALPVFDALYPEGAGVRFVVCRHEAGAAHMAEADAKLRGSPGVCIVSRGPGAMHGSVGLHTALQDSTPLLMIVGQVPRYQRGREAFQEMDYVRTFADMTKWVGQVEEAARIPELVSRAMHTATSGRAGPVVLSIPEDVLCESCTVADTPPFRQAVAAPRQADMKTLLDLLGSAERPLMIVGGSGWSAASAARIQTFAAESDIPVAAAFRSQDIVNNDCDQYVGDLSLGMSRRLGERVKEADILVAVGDRLGDVTTKGYSLVAAPTPVQKLVHVHPGAEELGRVFVPNLPILSNVDAFTQALADLPRIDAARWGGWRRECRLAYLDHVKPTPDGGELDLAKVILHLRKRLPDDAIVTNGAGNYNIWLHRFFSYRRFGTQIAPKAGVMGYGLPAAIAAKLRHPDRIVVGLAGDGCFMMALPEFASAAQHRLPIIMIVVNNSLYGSIRMHQERHFPGRPSGTSLENPDFETLAAAYGAYGEVVMRDADFAAALDRAIDAARPAILELRVDPSRLTPDTVL